MSRDTKLERDYQAGLIKRLERAFPGAIILKNDSGYRQGIPDLSVFHGPHYAILEVKAREPQSPDDYEPNQEWYLEQFDLMSFASVIHPENEIEVFDAIQAALLACQPSSRRS